MCKFPFRLHGEGTSLPDPLRQRLEHTFQTDLSFVKLHLDESPRQFDSRALCFGEHIFLQPSDFHQGTAWTSFLLAHEIAHVLQQRAGWTNTGIHTPIFDDPRLELAADLCGWAAATGQRAPAQYLPNSRIAEPRPAVQCTKLSIGKAKAANLLKAIDDAVEFTKKKYAIYPASKQLKYAIALKMVHPANWLSAIGSLAVTGQNDSTHWLPCKLDIPLFDRYGYDVTIEVKHSGEVWSERAYFPGFIKGDLNYGEIANEFSGFGKSDKVITEKILRCLMGQPWSGGLNERQKGFIAGLVALIFGVEASRFKSAIASGLMILDLIFHQKTYGTTSKPFTLKGAFQGYNASGEVLEWDVPGIDNKAQWYGGKFPLAVHGTGSGNMRAYQEMMSGSRRGRFHVSNADILTQRHAVARRTVSLFIHWLESQLDDRSISNLTKGRAELMLKQRLKLAFVDRQLPTEGFTYHPRATTGIHHKELLPGNKVCWLEGGQYYHRNKYCKLIQGRYHSDFAKEAYKQEFQYVHVSKRKVADKVIAQAGDLKSGTPSAAAKAKKIRCPKCGLL